MSILIVWSTIQQTLTIFCIIEHTKAAILGFIYSILGPL